MKKVLTITVAALLAIALMVGCAAQPAPAAPVQNAPAEAAPAQNAPAEAAPAEAAPVAAKTYKIGMIPKFTGVDYFIACENGARAAAKDLGVDLDWQGDPSGQESAAKQQAYIQTFIDKGYDAILVSALDPSSYADTLKQAMAQGIAVISWDADVEELARNYFVNQAKEGGYGVPLMKNMGKENPNGYCVIVSSDPNASNQNSWIEAIKKEYESKKDTDYKGIKFHDTIAYAGNSQAEADRVVNTLLTQNPDINGVFAISSMALPATSKACEDLGRPKGSVSIQGAGVPESVRAQLESGEIKSVMCSQPYDLGYLTVEFTKAFLDGKVKDTDTQFVSSLSGKSQLGDKIMYEPFHTITTDKQLFLAEPIAYTYEDLDLFKGYPDATSGLNKK